MFLGPLCSVVLFGLLATTDFVMTHHQIDIQAIFSHCAHLLNQIVIDINGNCGHSLRAELKRNTNIYNVHFILRKILIFPLLSLELDLDIWLHQAYVYTVHRILLYSGMHSSRVE